MIKTYKPNDTARVEAMKLHDSITSRRAADDWVGPDIRWSVAGVELTSCELKTLEGWVCCPFGSYIIKGTNNEFYPCDPDVFENRWVTL